MSQESPFGRRCNRRAGYLGRDQSRFLAEVNAVISKANSHRRRRDLVG